MYTNHFMNVFCIFYGFYVDAFVSNAKSFANACIAFLFLLLVSIFGLTSNTFYA